MALSACSQSEKAAAPEATPTTSAAIPAPSQAGKVPAAFLGVWDYVKGSCEPASDLRIEIKPDAIEFYEAHGDITKVNVESPDTVVLDLAMDGEGEQWAMSRRFTLSNGGETLTPTGMGEEKFEPMPLKRCKS
jgi:hypothetical protein